MATTAAKLRAVVTAETADGQKKLRQFGDEVSGLRRTTEKEVNAIAAVFKGTLSAGLVLGGLHAAANALGSILSGLWNTARQVMGDAYAAVRDYEMLALGLRQLTASQIVGAGVTSDMAEALKLAEEPAKRLIGWIEKLAVKSPFTSAEVAAAFRMAEAFGFTEGQARRLTAALTDFSAGAGLSGDYINRIMLNLGQMQAQGKVTSREIRDLAMAGLPVKNILAESFGVTQAKMAEMLEDGAVPVGQALESIVNFLETRFAGAAERTTQTWQGLQSSLQDIQQIDLRELFGGVFEAIRPEAAQIVDFLASDEFRGKLRAVGTALGDSVKAGVAAGKQALNGLFDAGFLGEAGDFLNQIKGGSFAQSLQKIVGAIEFGVMSAAVEVKAVGSTLWEVGKFIAEVLREFLARLGGLVTIFGSVIDTKSNAIITRMEA
ncbi:MAG: tape measure protein, partial [Anaerolineaceae bacterium]|nr:tape measure protein [Anaerolineaceae bacterium]